MIGESLRLFKDNKNFEQGVFFIVKRHFSMRVATKQYKLMCLALLDALKYCYEKEFDEILEKSWRIIFSNLLSAILKYAIALDILYLENGSQLTYTVSSGSFFDDGSKAVSTQNTVETQVAYYKLLTANNIDLNESNYVINDSNCSHIADQIHDSVPFKMTEGSYGNECPFNHDNNINNHSNDCNNTKESGCIKTDNK